MSERTVFVSYSRKDSDKVQHAVSLLEAGGAQVFRDLDDIQFGDRWEMVIREKLAEAERVLVFWSEHAKASEWVTKEWEIAVDLGKRLVPVLLDETPMPPALGQFHALTNFMSEKTPNPVKALNPRVKYTVLTVGVLSAGIMATILFVPFSQDETKMAEAPATEPSVSISEPMMSSSESATDDKNVPRPTAAPAPAPYPNVTAPPPIAEQPTPETEVTTSAAPGEVLTVQERQQLGGLAIGTILVGFAILFYWFKRRRQRAAAAAPATTMAAPEGYGTPDDFVEQVFTEYK